MYLITATVTQTLGVQIIFYTDTAAHVRDFRIMRSESESGPFEEIGTVENSGHEEISYFDATADFNSRSYYYQVEVTDSCGTRLMIANTARSIFLTVEANDQLENVLSWNDYEFWDGGVAGYNIQRRLNDDITWYQLGQTPVGLTTYTDNVAGLSGNAARIRYRIVAFEGGTNQYGYESSSFSNEVTAEQESKFFVPNAIAPKGLNQVLKPVAFFVGSEGYEFFIYNRWGQQIFFTADPEQGWDGRFKGKYVEQGVYVYLIRYRDTLGEVRLQKGNVAVIY
jgi:gliding motility-associated-like protein